MNCQSLFMGKSKENVINLSSAEFAQSVIKVNRKNIPLSVLYVPV